MCVCQRTVMRMVRDSVVVERGGEFSPVYRYSNSATLQDWFQEQYISDPVGLMKRSGVHLGSRVPFISACTVHHI